MNKTQAKRPLTTIRLALPCVLLLATAASAFEPPEFETDIRPILASKCVRCHGEQTRKAELNLADLPGLMQGGESGAVLALENPADSLLLELVSAGEMPPEGAEPLTRAERELIRSWILLGETSPPPAAREADAQLTQHDVLPVLFRRCTVCHGGTYSDGQLSLRSKQEMLVGGAHGPAIDLENPADSRMLERVRQRQCPPAKDIGEAGIEPMTETELGILQDWIAAGAPEVDGPADLAATSADPLVSAADRTFWSFQPLAAEPAPPPTLAAAVRNPIDAFLRAKLAARQLHFSPPADRATLLRRAAYDLTGLPPEPEEVRRFLTDASPRAYAALIDRLLASPRYGERWGRFWLDLAGYADSEGKRQADMVRTYAFRYRDYVVRSFNADKPYNLFLIEQLAGDELVEYADAQDPTRETIEKLVATGFLRMAPDGTSADPVNRISDRVEVIADTIDVVSRGLLGLTLKCARCHSHKYDPLPQRDYYRFVAIFKGAYDEYDWLTPQEFGNQWARAQRRFLSVTTAAERAQVEQHNAPLRKRIEQLTERLEPAEGKQKKQIQQQIKRLRGQLRQLPQIRALWDRGRPSPTYIYRRGDETQPTRPVRPGIPAVLHDPAVPYTVVPPPHAVHKTGRRLALARWLAAEGTPAAALVARVLVNRVWQRHFGAGIVRSADNFGRLGTPPSHRELLDWLAAEFIAQGWSIKQLHRQIMTSAAYQQTSELRPLVAQRDPQNRWLSRMPMRRLDAEQLRDAMLYVSGRLAEQPFGSPDPVELHQDGLVTSKPIRSAWRRSIYVRQRRKEMPTLLETFDLPQMNPNCTQRADSTVVSQPLYLLNNKLIHDLSTEFAGRVLQETSRHDVDQQLELAYLRALSRRPAPLERLAGKQLLAESRQQWQQHGAADPQLNALADLCHMLFNSAAFLYID